MIYDISQELFSCRVWPGDPAPERDLLADMSKGDIINLTAFSMCAHNGTHLDAPAHFIKEGKTVTELNPVAYLGDCYLTHHEGDVTAADARRILAEAAAVNAARRILIGGKATVTEAAARDRRPRKRPHGGTSHPSGSGYRPSGGACPLPRPRRQVFPHRRPHPPRRLRGRALSGDAGGDITWGL